MKNDNQPKILDYNPTSFSQGRMDFTWEKLTDDERQQAYDDWQAGKGLIGGYCPSGGWINRLFACWPRMIPEATMENACERHWYLTAP